MPWHAVPGGFVHRAEATARLVQNGNVGTLARLGWDTFFGAAHMVLLKLELERFRDKHLQRFSLAARPVEPRDMPVFFSLSDQAATPRSRCDVARRLFMLQAGIKTCYVVEDSRGEARFLQWLILPSENERLTEVYGKWYPTLRPEEAMIEHAYVLPQYRGSGLLPCAVSRVLRIARASGVRQIVTFIPTWNKNSLNSFMRLGFTPYQERTDRKFFGVRFRQAHPIVHLSARHGCAPAQRSPSL